MWIRVQQLLLKARKQQWARDEDQKRINQPDPDCPPGRLFNLETFPSAFVSGMVLIDEEERLETLAILQDNYAKAQKELSRMPLQIETQGQKKRQTLLEGKLQELEGALKIFSRKKVYVKDD